MLHEILKKIKESKSLYDIDFIIELVTSDESEKALFQAYMNGDISDSYLKNVELLSIDQIIARISEYKDQIKVRKFISKLYDLHILSDRDIQKIENGIDSEYNNNAQDEEDDMDDETEICGDEVDIDEEDEDIDEEDEEKNVIVHENGCKYCHNCSDDLKIIINKDEEKLSIELLKI